MSVIRGGEGSFESRFGFERMEGGRTNRTAGASTTRRLGEALAERDAAAWK